MIGKDKDRVTTTVKKDIKEKIQELAEKEGRSESSMVARLINFALETYEDTF
ncbi:MAG: ribbon-helix-helix protein, CopG family [Candidatus Izemoplasmatales bacterium]|nr:ribbon-helix-helix protein, CopG family [Candidatus Izemoplasmatales bacterium]